MKNKQVNTRPRKIAQRILKKILPQAQLYRVRLYDGRTFATFAVTTAEAEKKVRRENDWLFVQRAEPVSSEVIRIL